MPPGPIPGLNISGSILAQSGNPFENLPPLPTTCRAKTPVTSTSICEEECEPFAEFIPKLLAPRSAVIFENDPEYRFLQAYHERQVSSNRAWGEKIFYRPNDGNYFQGMSAENTIIEDFLAVRVAAHLEAKAEFLEKLYQQSHFTRPVNATPPTAKSVNLFYEAKLAAHFYRKIVEKVKNHNFGLWDAIVDFVGSLIPVIGTASRENLWNLIKDEEKAAISDQTDAMGKFFERATKSMQSQFLENVFMPRYSQAIETFLDHAEAAVKTLPETDINRKSLEAALRKARQDLARIGSGAVTDWMGMDRNLRSIKQSVERFVRNPQKLVNVKNAYRAARGLVISIAIDAAAEEWIAKGIIIRGREASVKNGLDAQTQRYREYLDDIPAIPYSCICSGQVQTSYQPKLEISVPTPIVEPSYRKIFEDRIKKLDQLLSTQEEYSDPSLPYQTNNLLELKEDPCAQKEGEVSESSTPVWLRTIPPQARTSNATGHQLVLQKKWQEAIPYLARAIQLYARYDEAMNDLAICYEKTGNLEKAVQYFEQAVRICQDPSKGTYLNNLAILHCEQGRYDEAIPLFEQALQIRPSDKDIQENLNACRANKGEGNSVEALNNRGIQFGNEERWSEAAAAFEEAFRLAPENTTIRQNLTLCLNNWGVYLANQGNYQEALPHLNRAVELKPDYQAAWQNLAMCYENMGNTKKAREIRQQH